MSENNSEKKQDIHIECITPILNVQDMAVSRNFYINILGFREAEWGSDNFTCVNRDKAALYLCKGEQGNAGTWVWIGFEGDIFSLYNELKSKGATIRQPPVKHSWAMEMQVEDPDGHILRLGTDPD